MHDFYRQFIVRDAGEKHYVLAGRLATLGLFFFSAVLTSFWIRPKIRSTSSCKSAPAPACCIWCAGFGGGLMPGAKSSPWSARLPFPSAARFCPGTGQSLAADKALLLTVAVTTVCWVATAFIAPQTDLATLIAFYKRTRPFGPGWNKIRLAAGCPRPNPPAPEIIFPWPCWAGWLVAALFGPRCSPLATFFMAA